MKYKTEINSAKLLGEFIGTLEGICLWDIPKELEIKLKSHIFNLTNQYNNIKYEKSNYRK